MTSEVTEILDCLNALKVAHEMRCGYLKTMEYALQISLDH